MPIDLENLVEAYLHDHIPISGYMGAHVLEANEDRVRIGFPLEPNINHRQTAFGGSIASAATLSAWSLIWVRLREMEPRPRLVIQANTVTYSRPVETEFVATTEPIDDGDWHRFLESLNRRGRGRIDVSSVVSVDSLECSRFLGTFIAIR